jgi:hypothetical protein
MLKIKDNTIGLPVQPVLYLRISMVSSQRFTILFLQHK